MLISMPLIAVFHSETDLLEDALLVLAKHDATPETSSPPSMQHNLCNNNHNNNCTRVKK